MSTVRIQVRRGTASQWTSVNPILAAGELGVESDTNLFKFGNGSSTWTALAYANNSDVAIGEISQDAINAALTMGSGLTKTYDDVANTITLDIDSTIATKTYADGAVSTHSSDTTSVHGITDTAELATKAFAATLLTGATKSNITITGDKNGLTISAENGVADSTTDNLTEGSTNKYFTDERAQDAVGNAAGTGLSYNDSTGAISVNTSTIQERVSGVSDTEIGYLNGVTSAIQQQIDAKAPKDAPTFTGEMNAQDLIISGNLTVNGTNTILNTDTLQVEDNEIILNSNVTGAPSLNGEITINRGTSPDAKIIWNETVDKWELSTDGGATSKVISTENYVDTNLSSHTSKTTDVHGITDSANLAYLADISEHASVTQDVHGITDTANLAYQSDISTHNSDTTDVHGIEDTANLAYQADISTHNSDTTDVHGILNTANLAYQADISTHNSDTTSVHGITDTAELATKTYADSAQSGAESYADGILTTHNSDTTSVHGITDTAELATKTYADTAVSNHSADTTDVHGITDTSLLATKAYADGKASDAQSAAITASGTAADTKISTHSSDTTDVHGITDTTALATKTYADNAVDTHSSDTTAVHGITDTSKLVTTDDTGSVTSTMIANGTIVNADINASAAIALSKLATDPLARANHTGSQTASTISDFNEAAQDAIGTILGTGLSYNDAGPGIGIDNAALSDYLLDGVSGASYGLIGTSAYLDVKNNNGYNKEIELDIAAVESKLETDGFAKLASPTFTGTVTIPAGASISGFAPLASPTFTGTVSGVSKSMVGLGSVDNTSDAGKPVSTATQTALDLKANLAGPTFTGTVSGITKSMVGLGSVDNTADTAKPISTATQTALDAKLALAGGTMTGALTLSGAPSSDLHAATKAYVDGISAGINFHQSVVAATSGNLAGTYNNGTNGYGATITKASNGSIGTIDGATVAAGDRILLRAQTDTTQNGIYVITSLGSAGTPWVVTRAADADNNPSGELATGDFTFVTGGSTYANTGFILSTSGTITVGTTGVAYTQFNAAQAILAGTGLSKTGGTLSIDTATTVDLSTAQTLSNKTLTTPVLGVATATSINGTTIPSSKTLVTTADTGTVTSTMILDGTIVDADINASAAIATSKISGLDTALAAKLASATAATTYAPINNASFTGTFSAPSGTITSSMILDGTIATGDIADSAITSAKIADGTIVDADINASAAIAQSKISGLTSALSAKAPVDAPTFTNLVTVAASGIAFTDGTQTKQGVPSQTTVAYKTAGFNITDANYRDQMIEVGAAATIVVTADGTNGITYPKGTSIDILQTTAGQVVIQGTGATVNGTPGLKLRAQWSSATLFKRDTNLWVLIGDLSA